MGFVYFIVKQPPMQMEIWLTQREMLTDKVIYSRFFHINLKAAIGKFGVNFWKNFHNTHGQLLVSDMVWEYCEISVLSHHASVFRIGKNPIAPIPYAQSAMLSVLSVLIGQSTQCSLATGDVGMSWWAVRTLRTDSPLQTQEGLQATLSVSASSSWDSTATFPSTVSSQFKLDLKRERTKKRNKMQAGANGSSKVVPQQVFYS